MEQTYFPKITELKRNLSLLEKSLNVKINLKGKLATITSESGLEEYEAHIVLEAMAFGFSAKKALRLKSEDFQFQIIKIKDFTRKKNLKEVRARVIGTQGKTLKTMENISDADIILNEDRNEIGVIATSETILETMSALQNLIRGTKQSNVYYFLEKQNKNKKEQETGHLGLRK